MANSSLQKRRLRKLSAHMLMELIFESAEVCFHLDMIHQSLWHSGIRRFTLFLTNYRFRFPTDREMLLWTKEYARVQWFIVRNEATVLRPKVVTVFWSSKMWQFFTSDPSLWFLMDLNCFVIGLQNLSFILLQKGSFFMHLRCVTMNQKKIIQTSHFAAFVQTLAT